MDGLNQRIDADHYDMGFSRKILESQRKDDAFRYLDSDSINRRYENENNLLRGYENNSDTIKSIQNDLRKFDHSLNNTLRSDKTERNGNENMENKRLDNNLLTADSINLSGTLSDIRTLGNYDNTLAKVLDDCTLTRRLKDDVPDVSCNSMTKPGNH